MSELYTVVEADQSVIDTTHSSGIANLSHLGSLYPNQYLVLKNPVNKSSVIVRVLSDCQHATKIFDGTKKRGFKLKPRNIEQTIAIDALTSDIPAVVLTGIAGGGKTIVCAAVAMYLLEHEIIDKVVITKPMSTIGKYQLGYLPGSAYEKFEPYLINYRCNFEQLMGRYQAMDELIASGRLEILPLQLMRGASFARTMLLVDEAQVLTVEDMISIGTRIGEESKIVFIGDLDQRDEPIAKEETGLYKLFRSEKAKQSSLVAQIELSTCVRSSLAAQFSSFF